MENEVIKLWAFYYCHMTWESSAVIISYHRTKKGAEEARRKHKAEAREKFDRIHKNKKDWKPKFGSFESWFVERFELLIQD